MRLDDCTPEETVILTSIVALSLGLPGDFAKYSEALGELRRVVFKGRKRLRNKSGFIESRQVRASERYGR